MDDAAACDRRRSSASSSPEFRFWPVDADPAASPSCADELFSGGVLLPLPVLHPRRPCGEGYGLVGAAAAECLEVAAVAGGDDSAAVVSRASPAAASAPGGGSKRWTDIFAKKPAEEKEKEKEARRKDGAGCRRPAAATGGGSGSELNINIWPFSRSRSAGGGGSASKPRPPPRKACSAPCSRSNSRGEGASSATTQVPPRRWAASPGRAGGGVPVGRSSPVWQIKRSAAAKHTNTPDQPADKKSRQKDKPAGSKKPSIGGSGVGSGMRGINLSVNSCIGYRHQVSCRRADAGVPRSPGVPGGGLFGIKGFFSKKVH
ncbi:hypothetical protein ABZP36_009462 [Zizania latifolia]